ncbi:PASTA domain-containing protein [Streptosporangium amethystogenes]|uniref:PASTA domain-containing protein n=1 Tax=Streptosporangium amethystogenes TaxID=2002 RepID=UPI0012F78664|nr:PASTA domain-containing protein [Streptosporangium amethystogenes]
MVRPFLILMVSLAAFLPFTSPGGESPDDTGDSCLAEVNGLRGWPLQEARQWLRTQARDIDIILNPADVPATWSPLVISAQSDCDSEATLELGTRVPNLIGFTLQQARDELTQIGLIPNSQPSNAAPDWKVANQNPGKDALVPYGTSVDFDVMAPVTSPPETSPPSTPQTSKPTPSRSQPPRVVVPSLTGLDRAEAKKKLAAVGLVLRLDPDSPRAGKVVTQDPSEDSKVARATKVTVWLEALEDNPNPGNASAELSLEGGAALAGLLLILLLVWSLIRRRSTRKKRARQSRPHTFAIHCVPHPDLTPEVEIHRSRSVSSPDIRVETYADPGRQELRKVLP